MGEGVDLLAAVRRAGNILGAEAKKADLPSGPAVRVTAPLQEGALFDALEACGPAVTRAIEMEDWGAAMAALATLREPVDAFFEAVLVNDPDPDVRANRLRLLMGVREQMMRVADFSKVAG
jgi:glycyl-tRNA synthetase beta chain